MERRGTRHTGPDRDAFRGRESYDESRGYGERVGSRRAGSAFDPYRRTRSDGYESDFFGAGDGRGAGAGSRRYREIGDGPFGGGESGAYGLDRASRDYAGGALDGGFEESLLDEGEPYGGPVRELPWQPESPVGGEAWNRGRSFSGRGGMERFEPTERYGRGRFAGGYPGPFAGRGPKGYRRSDERVTEEVNDRLMRDPWLDASEISVRVEDGVVRLDGAVDERRAKHRAEDLVAAVMGVREVENRLRIADPSADGERPSAAPEGGAAAGRNRTGSERQRSRSSANVGERPR
jgi:hypothetical protein